MMTDGILVVAHPFGIRITYHHGLNQHLFYRTKEDAQAAYDKLHESIEQGKHLFAASSTHSISIDDVSDLYFFEKPADTVDWEWLDGKR